MPKRRIFQIILAVLATPPTYFWLSYSYRWILTGRWVEGGGERAMFAFLISSCLLAPIAISEIDM